MRKDFYLNDRFLVKPLSNLIIDGRTRKVSRITPGLMHLLCTLSSENGKPISFETLSHSNYAPLTSDELRRNILSLQEILQDDNSEVIRGIGGDAFMLKANIANADINDLRTQAETGNPFGANAAQRWIIILSIVIVVMLLVFMIFQRGV